MTNKYKLSPVNSINLAYNFYFLKYELVALGESTITRIYVFKAYVLFIISIKETTKNKNKKNCLS